MPQDAVYQGYGIVILMMIVEMGLMKPTVLAVCMN